MDVLTEGSATKDTELDPKQSSEPGKNMEEAPHGILCWVKATLPSCSQELALLRAFRYQHSKWGPQG